MVKLIKNFIILVKPINIAENITSQDNVTINILATYGYDAPLTSNTTRTINIGTGSGFTPTFFSTNNINIGTSGAASGRPAVVSNIKFNGNIGFYNTTPVGRASAYTQTYSAVATPNAAKTHTVSTYVSPGAYVGGANGYSTTTQAQAIITALGQLNSDVTVVKNLINSIIDDLQAYGLFQST